MSHWRGPFSSSRNGSFFLNLTTPRNYTILYERWIYATMNNDSSGHRDLYVILFELAVKSYQSIC